jgi:DNA-binding MarR family transcriptional regulator
MTGRLDRMEDAGLLRRCPDPEDRRGVLIELTPRGRTVIDAAIDAHLVLYEQLTGAALTKAEQQKFIELTRKQTLAFEQGRSLTAARARSAAGDSPTMRAGASGGR